jgi:hypothetical protein
LDLKEYKFIVVSGCSYDKFAHSFTSPLNGEYYSPTGSTPISYKQEFYTKYPQFNELENPVTFLTDNVLMISLGIGGFGNQWVSESIINFINLLSSYNVPYSNIYVLASFTSFVRNSKEYSYNEITKELNKERASEVIPFAYYPQTTETYSLLQPLRSNPKIGRLKNYTGIGKINDSYIFNPIISSQLKPDKLVDAGQSYRNFIKQKHTEMYRKSSSDFKVDRSLSYIEKLGDFLETRKIDYNFCSMYSLFNNLNDKKEDSYIYDLGIEKLLSIYTWSENKRSWIRKVKNTEELNISSGIKLEKAFPSFKKRIQAVKKYNWVFYNYKYIKYGGIDEYTQHKFGPAGYGSIHRVMLDNSIPRPQNHPISLIYPAIFEYFARDCKFIKVNIKYLKTLNKYLDYFYNKKGFNPKDTINYPILTADVFKDSIKEFTEIRDL